MVNANLFRSGVSKLPKTDGCVNLAGGAAYELSPENKLAQYVVTSCLNNVFYSDEESQLDNILNLAKTCDVGYVAKCAVYGHKYAKMKDTPALLLAVLASRSKELTDITTGNWKYTNVSGLQLFEAVFPIVVTNTKMLRNFTQILRSGKVGRKSYSSALKRVVRKWLASRTAEQLFLGSIGGSPSLADIVKMVHPKPENQEKNAFYSYLLGKEHTKSKLPKLVRQFEDFKAGKLKTVPNVPFQMLSSLPVTDEQWKDIARNMPWNTLRMNLNTLSRHNVFADTDVVKEVAKKLRDKKEVSRSRVFPYSILTTLDYAKELPAEINLALQEALDLSVDNVPSFGSSVAVLVDSSGSMNSPVTGTRKGSTTKVSCIEVARLMASCVVRKNPRSTVISFDTSARPVNLNPRDSVYTNAKMITNFGGGTTLSAPLHYLNTTNWKGDMVIMLTDMQSWCDSRFAAMGGDYTRAAQEWDSLRRRNPGCKMVFINLQPCDDTQVPNQNGVLNIGGWSESVFDEIARFAESETKDFVTIVHDKVDISGNLDRVIGA